MTEERIRFHITAGDSFERTFIWKDSDGDAQSLADYTLSIVFRIRTDSSAALLTLTEGSGITVAGDDLSADWIVTNTQSATMFTDAGGTNGESCQVQFDLVGVNGTSERTFLRGTLVMHGDTKR